MNEDLISKLLKDLDKTGFISEMKALKTFIGNKWIAYGASSYFDKDSNVSREIDLKANTYRGYTLADGRKISCFYQIVAEVKKTSQPWLVFKQHINWDWQLRDAWTNLITSHNLPLGGSENLTKSISEYSLAQTSGWIGSGIHESFKDPSVSSRWYSAFVSACKASEHTLEANTRKDSHEEVKKGNIYLFFVKPLVILDGLLVSAELNEDGSVNLAEVDAALFKFDFRTATYDDTSQYSVDVVRLSGLDEYIKLSEKRIENILRCIIKDSKE